MGRNPKRKWWWKRQDIEFGGMKRNKKMIWAKTKWRRQKLNWMSCVNRLVFLKLKRKFILKMTVKTKIQHDSFLSWVVVVSMHILRQIPIKSLFYFISVTIPFPNKLKTSQIINNLVSNQLGIPLKLLVITQVVKMNG